MQTVNGVNRARLVQQHRAATKLKPSAARPATIEDAASAKTIIATVRVVGRRLDDPKIDPQVANALQNSLNAVLQAYQDAARVWI